MVRLRGFEKIDKYEAAKIPVRATKSSAGYDFFAAEDIVIDSVFGSGHFYNTTMSSVLDLFAEEEPEEFEKWSEKILTIESIDAAEEAEKVVLECMDNDYLRPLWEVTNKSLKPVLVSTGIKAYMLEDEFLQLANRSSGPSKRGLILTNGVGIVDSDYYNNKDNEGHIMFQFINYTLLPTIIKKGDAIGQGVFMKFLAADESASQVNNVERTGGHGSTSIGE